MFKHARKPYMTVPFGGLRLLSNKVQCYCLLEVFIIHLGLPENLTGQLWF